jgi:hypothetical protein
LFADNRSVDKPKCSIGLTLGGSFRQGVNNFGWTSDEWPACRLFVIEAGPGSRDGAFSFDSIEELDVFIDALEEARTVWARLRPLKAGKEE